MSEEEEKPKSKFSGSRILIAIVAIILIIVGIYYIISGAGML